MSRRSASLNETAPQPTCPPTSRYPCRVRIMTSGHCSQKPGYHSGGFKNRPAKNVEELRKVRALMEVLSFSKRTLCQGCKLTCYLCHINIVGSLWQCPYMQQSHEHYICSLRSANRYMQRYRCAGPQKMLEKKFTPDYSDYASLVAGLNRKVTEPVTPLKGEWTAFDGRTDSQWSQSVHRTDRSNRPFRWFPKPTAVAEHVLGLSKSCGLTTANGLPNP
jgi:hypothetical protein